MPNTNKPHVNSSVLESIRLRRDHDTVLVASDAVAGTEEFALPPLSKSLSDWLALGSDLFRQRHRRCVAVLLVFDLTTRRWGYGIPRQQASCDAVCWRMLKEDFPGMSTAVRVAGSLQMRVLSPGEEPHDAVPPFDGLHLVQIPQQPQQTIWTFVRVGHQVNHVPAADVMCDDLEGLVLEFESRSQIV